MSAYFWCEAQATHQLTCIVCTLRQAHAPDDQQRRHAQQQSEQAARRSREQSVSTAWLWDDAHAEAGFRAFAGLADDQCILLPLIQR